MRMAIEFLRCIAELCIATALLFVLMVIATVSMAVDFWEYGVNTKRRSR